MTTAVVATGDDPVFKLLLSLSLLCMASRLFDNAPMMIRELICIVEDRSDYLSSVHRRVHRLRESCTLLSISLQAPRIDVCLFASLLAYIAACERCSKATPLRLPSGLAQFSPLPPLHTLCHLHISSKNTPCISSLPSPSLSSPPPPPCLPASSASGPWAVLKRTSPSTSPATLRSARS